MLCQIVTAGELGALLAHIGFQIGNQRRALRLATAFRWSALWPLIDRSIAKRLDAAHDSIAIARGHLLLAAALRARFPQDPHGEERAPGMDQQAASLIGPGLRWGS